MKIEPVNMLMSRGAAWALACHAVADGLDYKQYYANCMEGCIMAINSREFELVDASVKAHYERAGQPL